MKQFKKTIPAFIILVFGIVISFGIQIKYKEEQLAAINKEIDLLIENKLGTIQYELTTSFSSLEFLKYLFEENSDLTREDFFNYTSPILKGAPGIKALSWVPKIKIEEREKYESNLQSELNSDLTIWTRNRQNARFVAQERPIYFPITYIEPFEKNNNVIGYDIYSSGSRRATINRAINEKELFITSRIKLVQDTTGYGFMGILPVYRSFNSENKIVENIDTLYGLLTGSFKVDEIISTANRLSSEYEFDLVIFDSTHKDKEIIYGDENLFLADVIIQKRELKVAGRMWEISFVFDSNYYKVKETWIYLLVGFSISLTLFILFLLPFIKEERSRRLSLKLNEEKQVRRVTEQTLSESEEYNRTLFTQSSIGLALATMDGKLVDVNPAFANIIGRTINETKTLSYWDITPDKYVEQEKEQLKLLKENGEYGPYTKEYIHKTGQLIPVRLKGKIIKQKGIKYIWSSVEDITEQKRHENALINSEKKFRALVEQSLTGIYIFEKEKFIYVNKRFCEIFGYSEEEILLGLQPSGVIADEEKAKTEENIDKRLSGEIDSVRYTARGKHKEGKELWVEIHGTHIKYEGSDVITGTVLDITERKLSEEKIKNLNQELEEKVENRTKELNDKLLELERMNGIFINREFRIKELKEKIKELENSKQ